MKDHHDTGTSHVRLSTEASLKDYKLPIIEQISRNIAGMHDNKPSLDLSLQKRSVNYGTCYDKLIEERVNQGIDKNISFVKEKTQSEGRKKQPKIIMSPQEVLFQQTKGQMHMVNEKLKQ